ESLSKVNAYFEKLCTAQNNYENCIREVKEKSCQPDLAVIEKHLQKEIYKCLIFSGEYRNRTDDLLTASQQITSIVFY
ncbi:MAG: hypothetical protein Q8T08_13190, partial [Ignavibacteria bacterium]|nr:hypothetical protein [Ignavibacteria bacterium]